MIQKLDDRVSGSSSRQVYSKAWVERMKTSDQPLRYLALSGGGEDGAFGAGFLHGWASVNGGRLPDFEIVTGVSTGALIATFAFIGQTDKLSIYRTKGDEDLVSRRPLLFALFSDSLYKNDKLRNELEKLIDHDVLVEVAKKRDRRQQLLVGAVNLDTNEFKIFDLTEIAARYVSSPEDSAGNIVDPEIFRQRYIDAVIASTAIPIVFNPSFIDCQMYVDGGAREQVFLREARKRLAYAARMALEMAPGGTAATKPTEIYTIINGRVTLRFDGEADDTLLGIGGRSVNAILNANLNNDIRNICAVSADAKTSVTSMDRLNPDAYDQCYKLRQKGNLFSQGYMNCLYEEAELLARSDAMGQDGSKIAPWGSCPSRQAGN